MKTLRLVIAIMLLASITACTAQQVKTTGEIATVVAETAYTAACGYYQTHATQFSPEDAALFEAYLTRFRLALDQGYSVAEMVAQWYAFYGSEQV